jgi:alcohol dehydrogenase
MLELPVAPGAGGIGRVRAGLIDLGQFDLTEFALDAANDAVAFAAGHAGPLRLTVLRPDQ